MTLPVNTMAEYLKLTSILLYLNRQILNKIVEEWEKSDLASKDKRLKELLGHTPKEVIAGAILGIIIALVRYL